MAYSDPRNQDAKPGWKTTEFWVSFGVIALGTLLETGLLTAKLPEDYSWVPVVTGAILQMAAAMGYTKARAQIKVQTALGAVELRAKEMNGNHNPSI